MEERKLFGKYHDLVLLFVGFVLTAIVGTYIQHRFETANAQAEVVQAQRAARAEVVEAQRVLATGVYEDVSGLIDQRSYHLLTLSSMLHSGAPDSLVQQQYRRYLSVYEEWESSINRNRAMVCRFFGYWPNSKFMTISNAFDAIDRTIVPWTDLKQIGREQAGQIHNGVVNLQKTIFPFNNEMAEAIRAGTIGDAAIGQQARECSH